MASKCCSTCAHTLPLSSFLADPSNSKSKIRVTCIKCRDLCRKSWLKRKALQPLDPNVPSKRRRTARTEPTHTPSISPPHIPSETRPQTSICPPPNPNHTYQLLLPVYLDRLLKLPCLPLLQLSLRASCRQINGGSYRSSTQL
jgi:hypothetical protein